MSRFYGLSLTILSLVAGCAAPVPEIASDSEALSSDITRIVAGPTYKGTNLLQNQCVSMYRTTGYAPTDAGPHPLFLYFVGTGGNYNDDLGPPGVVTRAMAARGYFALSVAYDNTFANNIDGKLHCLFTPSVSEGLVAKVCADSRVNCEAGITTWGHSQGGLIALLAGNTPAAQGAFGDARVRAAWATGVGEFDGNLATSRMRIVNGQDDGNNGNIGALNAMTSSMCTNGPTCLRPEPDGSGWVLVQRSDLDSNRKADHCWFTHGCGDTTPDQNWAHGTGVSSVSVNTAWLALAGRTPR